MKKLMIALSAMLFVTACNNVTELPQVTTTNPMESDTAFIVGGDVSFTGGDNKTARGVCWSTSPNPTTSDNFMLDASKGAGVYSFDILGQLMPETEYYFKAYAENSVGKSYGNELNFETSIGNPNNAIVNGNGCLECDNYTAGESFMIDGVRYEVEDRAMLLTAIADGDDLTRYCTSRIVDMSVLFYENQSFNQDISSWDVSNVTTMNSIFKGATAFNQDIVNWDVSNVTDMKWMFVETSFNQDIGSWDVSNVTDMKFMFYGSPFNQDIGSWDVGNVTNMQQIFREASNFNQDIGSWDVSSVTDMSWMFDQASAFNQDIGSWDVSSVTDMNGIFRYTTNFNQDLTKWCVSNINSIPTAFSTNSALTASNHPVWGTCP